MKKIILTLLLPALFFSCTNMQENRDLNIASMNFKFIPKGDFNMGTSQGSSDQQPERHIKLTKNFWLAEFEFTQAQWKKYMGRSIQDQRDLTNENWSLRGVGPQHPIYYISWQECQELISKLNQAYAQQLPKAYTFALPTEAQWEYACQAQQGPKPLVDLSTIAWFDGNSDEQSHAVGSKNANAWGLHDMYGNVWEWCADRYDHYDSKDLTDPQGPKVGNVHSSRGASWHEGAGDCYVSKRDWYSADGRLYNLGLRLAILLYNHLSVVYRCP
jgi:formylglycine-generating enzyme required for sulfatase activity